MENKYYQRIEINGDVNRLPKEVGFYLTKERDGVAAYVCKWDNKPTMRNYWLRNVDWYEIPVPSPDSVIVGPTEEMIRKKAKSISNTKSGSPNGVFYDVCMQMAKWYRTQCHAVNLKDELVKFGTRERSRARDICMDFYRRKKNEEMRQCGNTIIGRTGLSDESETIMQIMKVVVDDYLSGKGKEGEK